MKEIVVISGKGGTGKTSLSAAFATLGLAKVVADCDVDAADLYLVLRPVNTHEQRFITGQKAVINEAACTNCGLCSEYCRFDAISQKNGKTIISGISCDGCQLCERICPEEAISMVQSDRSYWFSETFRNGLMVHARLAPGEENSGKLVNVVREQARKTAACNELETIIIDGPPGTSCPVISSLTGAGQAVIVTEPGLSAFHDLKRLLQLINNFKIKSCVIINKYDLNESITNQMTEWLKGAGIPLAGKLPFDRLMVDAMLQCKSITEYSPDSELSNEIKSIWKFINEMP